MVSSTAFSLSAALLAEPGAAADLAVRGALARQQFSVTGAGIRIGILSDSFDIQGSYATDVLNAALPVGVQVLKEGSAGGHDEGRAMAELVHRIAPDAQISFYTAFGGEADFAAGIGALARAGAQVIVDDVTYLDEPFFEAGGVVALAVAQAVAGGVSYFTAAGNQGANFYQARFAGVSTALPGLSGRFLAENFGTAAHPSTLQALRIAPGSSVSLDLQWTLPAAGDVAGGSLGAGSLGAESLGAGSLGMVLYDEGDEIVGYAMRNMAGGNPDQILAFTNTGSSGEFRLAIVTDGGSQAPAEFKYIAYGRGVQIEDAGAGIGSGTLIGHALVPGVNAVGAVDWASTPAFGGAPAAEWFSAAGKVAFLAPDGAATSVFAPFYGTSAAAPVAAATAALMLQADPALTPAEVSALLAQSAVAATGAAGAGVIQADAAVRLAVAAVGRPGVPAHAAPTPAGPTPAGPTPAAPNKLVAASDLGGVGLGEVLAALRGDPTSAADFVVTVAPAAALQVAMRLGGGALAMLQAAVPDRGVPSIFG